MPLECQTLHCTHQLKQHKSQPKLALTYQPIRNGLIAISITNFQNIFPDYDTTYPLDLMLEYRFVIPQENSSNNEWKSKASLYPLMDDTTHPFCPVYLKLPALLSTYTAEFRLEINNIDNTVTSCIYTVEIPPISIQQKYVVGDLVMYTLHSEYEEQIIGTVSELMTNNMVKIIQHEAVETHIVHLSNLVPNGVQSFDVVDATDRNQALCYLHFGKRDPYTQHIYHSLSEHLLIFYSSLAEHDNADICDDFLKPLSDVISCCILEFLYFVDEYHDLQCVFDGHHLCKRPHWQFLIRNEMKQTTWPWDRDLQCVMDTSCHIACGLCKVEITYYDFVYICQNEWNAAHCFCISCTHSLVLLKDEIQKYQELLFKSLKHELNDDCIKEIIKFCAGNVNDFHWKQKTNERTTWLFN